MSWVCDVGGEIGWNIRSVGLTSCFILLGKKTKNHVCLSATVHSGGLMPEDRLKLTISLISQHGGWKERIGTPALCCNGCCWQPLILDFMCFSSCLGGQWRAKGSWRICIYWTNLQLEFRSTSSCFSLGEAELLEEVQLWPSGSWRNPERGWLYSRLLWCFDFNDTVSKSWVC